MVSIVIPCYNYGKFLSEALDSIIAQTYQNWECIIVNDGSTDNSEEVSLNYTSRDKRFKYIYQANQGHSVARNKALQNVTGKYIQFLDADDLLQSEKLKFQVALFEENSYIDLIYSDVLLFDHTEKERKLVPGKIFTQIQISGKGAYLLDNLVEDNLFVPGCVLMRKEVYEKVGGLKASYGYEDWEFFSRAALMGFYFKHDNREGTKLMARGHGNNATTKYQKMLDSKVKVRTEIMNVIKRHPSNLSQSYLNSLIQKHYNFLINDSSTYEMYYGSFIAGLKFMLLDAWHSKKPFQAIKHGLYWRYLKLKGYKI